MNYIKIKAMKRKVKNSHMLTTFEEYLLSIKYVRANLVIKWTERGVIDRYEFCYDPWTGVIYDTIAMAVKSELPKQYKLLRRHYLDYIRVKKSITFLNQ